MTKNNKPKSGVGKVKNIDGKLIKVLICNHCGNEFESQRQTTKYCSNMCRQAAYRERKL